MTEMSEEGRKREGRRKERGKGKENIKIERQNKYYPNN